MKLSLIVTTQNRPIEFKRFIESINLQKGFDFRNLQVILVDQMGGGNKKVFSLLSPLIEAKFISYHKCGLSEARNIALPYVSGDIIGFGDDDSWYDNTTLKLIIECLKSSNLDGIGCVIENESGKKYSKYPSKETSLTYTNHCGVSSASMFLKHDKGISFDENIGVGSHYNLRSGEETDYLWTFMERHPKFKIVFHPEIIVRHPVCETITHEDLKKAYGYARGYGYILHKHHVPVSLKIKSIFRPLIGIIAYAITRPSRSIHSFVLLKGRLEGYFFKPPNF